MAKPPTQKHEELFALLDSNNNLIIENAELLSYINLFNDLGQITESDLTSMLHSLNIPDPKNPKNSKNPKNALNYDQFTDFMTYEYKLPFTHQDLLQVFAVYDIEKTGKIYWPRLYRDLEKCSDFFADEGKFRQWVGEGYWSGDWFDYGTWG
jgi:Ca2+-binding EF-hand superfamily protein